MPRHLPTPSNCRTASTSVSRGVLACALAGLVACAPAKEPFARLAGVVFSDQLSEISGVAASRTHGDVLWMVNDGGNAATLYAVSKRGRQLGAFPLEGVTNTDWEDLAAFELDGKRYVLIADTGDNGGLRKTLQLHVVEEPASLAGRPLRTAWSIAFRWPDGPRDCEAVAVDAARGEVLLVSKKRHPAELFTLPLRPAKGLQVAKQIALLDGIPQASDAEREANPARARLRGQVTSADLSPDGRTLAVLTYDDVLFYRRAARTSWPRRLAKPDVHPLPLLPQPEALAWSSGGRGLFATGEFSPAPMVYLVP